MVGTVEPIPSSSERAFLGKDGLCRRQAGKKILGRRNRGNNERIIGRCGAANGAKANRALALQTSSTFKTTDVLQTMAADLDSGPVQQAGCQALQWLAVQCGSRDKSTCQSDLVASGALDSVLKAMDIHLESYEVQVEGIGALDKICASHAQNTMYLVAHGGLEAVVQAMNQHVEQQSLQQKACHVLQNAAACSVDMQVKVASAAGIKAILQAMKVHSNAMALQEIGCRALKGLAAYNTGNQDEIYTHGGIQIILRSMELHSSQASIQVAGCGVLRNMTATSAAHQEAVAERGGIQVIIDGMLPHEETASVQWAGCWALFCMAVHNSQIQSEVAAHGAGRLALNALAKHYAEPKTQEAALWLIKELAGELVKDHVLFMSAVSSVLKTMGATSAAVRKAAGSALRQLAAHDTEGRVKTTCLGRCGRLGRSTTMKALEAIQE